MDGRHFICSRRAGVKMIHVSMTKFLIIRIADEMWSSALGSCPYKDDSEPILVVNLLLMTVRKEAEL